MAIKKLYTFSCVLFFTVCIDAVWLFSTSNILYKKYLPHLLSQEIIMLPVIIFYLLYALGITIFVVNPSLQEKRSLKETFVYGFFLGSVTYGAYDLVNHATLKNWPMIITIVDMAWGACLTAFSSTISYHIMKKNKSLLLD